MVWGVISFDSWIHLKVISDTEAAQLYDDILQLVMLLFLLRHLGHIFQHNNAWPHTARITMNSLSLLYTSLASLVS